MLLVLIHAIGDYMLDDVPLTDSATPAQRIILADARGLSHHLFDRWRTAGSYDEVMLLVADLLDAHADTGLELQTWPRALDVVTSHLAQDELGASLLKSLGSIPWFTVIGTWCNGLPEPVVVIPGKRTLATYDRAWQVSVAAPTAAHAAQAATRCLR